MATSVSPCLQGDLAVVTASRRSGQAPLENRHAVAPRIEFESKISRRFIILQFQELGSRHFQLGFHRVNLHRLTTRASRVWVEREVAAACAQGLTLVHFST
jgi:hypothetical protein